jgi:hypothetical protein
MIKVLLRACEVFAWAVIVAVVALAMGASLRFMTTAPLTTEEARQ